VKRELNGAWRHALGAAIWPMAVALRVIGRKPATAPRRVLVMRFGLLGDGVLVIPALRDLRDRLDRTHREARTGARATIDVLVTPLQRPVLARLVAEGIVDGLIDWTAGDLTELHRARHSQAWRDAMATIHALRARRYDLAVSCYGRLGSAVAVLAGIPQRAGLESEAFPGTLTHRAPSHRYTSKWHEAAHSLEAVRVALPFADDREPPPGMAPDPTAGGRHRLPVQPDEGAGARTRFGIPSGAHLVVLHPGATNGSAKRWPVASWAAVASRLVADGQSVAIVGGPEDRALGAKVVTRMPAPPSPIAPARVGLSYETSVFPPFSARAVGAVFDLTGRTTIDDLVGILATADAVVTGDSGPLHLAIALGRPVVAIHGPTDPDICGPVTGAGARVATLGAELPCRPCYSLARMADCPLGHTICQDLVTPRDVLASVAQVTGRSPAPAAVASRRAIGAGSSPVAGGETGIPPHIAALIRDAQVHRHDDHSHDGDT
jgi:ADP-heptose:LPS heptosyltransferase